MDGQGKGSGFMDIALPLASAAAASYSPTATAAVRTGLSVMDKRQQYKDRRELGGDVMRLADTMAGKEVDARKQQWDKNKPKPDVEVGKAMKEIPGAFDTVPRPGEEPGNAPEVKQHKDDTGRLDEFLKGFPEPVRDKTYAAIGELAMNDPKAALSMLSDREGFNQTVRLSEMKHYQDMISQRAGEISAKERQAEQIAQRQWETTQTQDFQAGQGKLDREARATSDELTRALQIEIQGMRGESQKQYAEIMAGARDDREKSERLLQFVTAKNRYDALTAKAGGDVEMLSDSEQKEYATARSIIDTYAGEFGAVAGGGRKRYGPDGQLVGGADSTETVGGAGGASSVKSTVSGGGEGSASAVTGTTPEQIIAAQQGINSALDDFENPNSTARSRRYTEYEQILEGDKKKKALKKAELAASATGEPPVFRLLELLKQAGQ